MLQAIGLTKSYGDHTALKPLDLEIGVGEIFCLLGANGAGKTTTINLFLDFIRPSGGEARIDGKKVADNPRETRRVTAYIPERVSLYENLTGLENLAYFSELAGVSRSRKDYLDLLEGAGLKPDFADKPVSGYSKGMRQKVAVATALARDAKVMLLDEPTSGLDPKAAGELSAGLMRLKERGVTVLMATHDLFRARETGTRVGIMKHGSLVADLATEGISASDLETVYLDHMHD
ncbi:MAG: ABC transporter ATP-binding protein [Acidobacteriota bacterium]|nr:ABC transporter ATP-binding protein [Acidobacteriota bacterium]